MHPILFTLPNGFSIHSYGVLTACAYLVAVWGVRRSARRVGLDPEIAYDMALVTVFAALIGSRLEYVRVNWDRFAGDPMAMFAVRDGGLVFYGGLIGVIVGLGIWIKVKGLKYSLMGDIVAPWLPLGHAFGRLGCLMAGCCHGAPTDLPWAVTYSSPDTMAPLDVALHPSQVYAILYNLGLAGFLLWMQERKRFDGQLMLVYLSIYPVLRSLNELTRGDGQRGYFLEDVIGQVLTNAQMISLVIAIAAAATWALFLSAAPKKKG